MIGRGPSLYQLPIAAAIAAGATLAQVRFRFPRPVFVTSIEISTLSGLRTDLSALRLRIQDECSDDLISDGIGGVQASALALCGTTPLNGPLFAGLVLLRPFALQRPVNGGDQWFFSIQNVGGAPITPELTIAFEEGRN